MTKRITTDIGRPDPVVIDVNGKPFEAYPGETLAAAFLAAGRVAFGVTRTGMLRGPVCNMGVCFECMVEVLRPSDESPRFKTVRACMTRVEDGLVVRTKLP